MGTRPSKQNASGPRPDVRPRHRDRRGRGVRGPLSPTEPRLARTRAERFDDLVLDAVELLERHWAAQLASVDFAVEDVPPMEELRDAAAGRAGPVPVSRHTRARGSGPSRIVIYRRPLEARAAGDALAAAVYEVVVEEFASVLGLEPQTVDPSHSDEG